MNWLVPESITRIPTTLHDNVSIYIFEQCSTGVNVALNTINNEIAFSLTVCFGKDETSKVINFCKILFCIKNIYYVHVCDFHYLLILNEHSNLFFIKQFMIYV